MSCLEILFSLLGTNEQQQQIWQKPREQADEGVPETPRLAGTMTDDGSWRWSLVQVSGTGAGSWILMPIWALVALEEQELLDSFLWLRGLSQR